MNATLGDVSANVRAELARARVSTISVIMQMSDRGMPMNRPKWMRRMDKPSLWTLDEVRTIAAILDIPLAQLTGTTEVPAPRQE